MDLYIQCVLIIGVVVFVKLFVIICIYALRARRRTIIIRQQTNASAYPTEPHTARSAIVNYEETPQPIMNMAPGTNPASLNPMMSPPPYSMVGGKDTKPPCYEQVLAQGENPPAGVQYANPATSEIITQNQVPPPQYTPNVVPQATEQISTNNRPDAYSGNPV